MHVLKMHPYMHLIMVKMMMMMTTTMMIYFYHLIKCLNVIETKLSDITLWLCAYNYMYLRSRYHRRTYTCAIILSSTLGVF